MTTEIDTLVSSLQTEITGLSSSSSTEDSIKKIGQHLQDLCSRLATKPDKPENQLSEQTQHTFRALEPSLTTPANPEIQALAQNHQLTELFQTAVYLSDPSHAPKPPPAVLQAIECYHHPLRIIPPKPLRSNPLNQEQVDLWLAAHPDEKLRVALRAAINAITHISQEEFEIAFTKSIESFNAQIKEDLQGKGKGKNADQHYVALTWPHKSQEWMLEMALPQLAILPREVLNLEKLIEELSGAQSTKESKEFMRFIESDISLERIVIFDDGIYSGAQIQTIISNFTNICFDLQLPLPKFYIVCPFITAEGHKSTTDFGKLLMRSIIFSNYKTLPSFHQRILQQPDSQNLWKILVHYLGITAHPYLESLSSYYFDHKIPDKTSSMITFFTDSLVRNSKGEIATHQDGKPIQFQLIPQTLPPYYLF